MASPPLPISVKVSWEDWRSVDWATCMADCLLGQAPVTGWSSLGSVDFSE